MYLKVLTNEKQYTFYDQCNIELPGLKIDIDRDIRINNRTHCLRKGLYRYGEYTVFFNPGRRKHYSNYKYRKLTHLEISGNVNALVRIAQLDHAVYIDGNILRTESEYVFINGEKCKYRILEEDDIVDILGLRIIYTHLFLMMNEKRLGIQRFKPEISHQPRPSEAREVKISYRREISKPVINHQLKSFNLKTQYNDSNIFISMLPSVLMAFSSVSVGFLSAFNAYSDGRAISELLVFLILPLSMLVAAVIVLPLQNHLLRKRQTARTESEYLEYENYLENIREQAIEAREAYLLYLDSRYQLFPELLNSSLVFMKQRYHSDYLNLSIGLGRVETGLTLECKTEDSRIQERICEINRKVSRIEKGHVEVALTDYSCISVVDCNDYFNYLLLQLITYYQPGIFNLVALVNDAQLSRNHYLRYIRHFRYHGLRLIARSVSDAREITSLLENSDRDTIVIVYDHSLVSAINLEARFIFICGSEDIHPSSELVIDAERKIYYSNATKGSFEYFSGDIERRIMELNEYSTGNGYSRNPGRSLYELFGIVSISDLSYPEYNNRLITPIGYDYENEVLNIDIHENAEGPHGLIVGATGSGKSEFIVSLLLSLAMSYPPDILNMVVIDFKGTNIISNLKFGEVTLPHIINSLSNIDEGDIERALLSFKTECRRRMKLFRRMSELTNESSMNIDLYQKLHNDRYGLERLPHILIVIDEFAELKSENDHFIREIISLTRVGRSLGIHLLLSTQKVSGIVSDEILANISYRVCLKLNDKAESKLIIGNDDAYFLKEPGEFCLYHNQERTYGRGVMSSVTSDLKSLSEKVIILDNMLHELSRGCIREPDAVRQNEAICRYLHGCFSHDYRSLWLDSLKQKDISLLMTPGDAVIVNGEYDNISACEQGRLEYDIETSALVFSMNTELKRRFAETFICSINDGNHKMVIIDFDYLNFRDYEGCRNIVTISENEGHIYEIFHYLENRKSGDRLLVMIYNGGQLYRNYSDLQERLYVLLNESYKNNLSFLIFLNSYQSINFRHFNLFRNKYVLDLKDRAELLNIFNEVPEYYEESLFFDGTFHNFKTAFTAKAVSELVFQETDEKVFRIPEIIRLEKNGDNLLIGYSIDNYCRVYHNLGKLLTITSFDNDLLEAFAVMLSGYSTIKVCSYQEIHVQPDYLLFLKPGIRKQYVLDNVTDVEHDDEAVYIRNHQAERIKYVNERLCKLQYQA